MKDREQKSPKGRRGDGRLFQRRGRDGTLLPTLWCAYYVRGADGRRGKERRESTGTTNEAEAQAFLHRRLGEKASDKLPTLESTRLTVGDLLTLLEEEWTDKGKELPAGHFPALRAELGHRRARDVKRVDLDAIVRRWKREGLDWPGRKRHRHDGKITTTTCNRIMTTLRRAFRLGTEKVEGFAYSLTFPVDVSAETERYRYIPPADFKAIHAVLPPVIQDLAEFEYLTGVRTGQLRKTLLANVVLEHGRPAKLVWAPKNVKNRKPHTIVLVGRVQEVIQEAWERRVLACPHLFHVNGRGLADHHGKGQVARAWRRACRTAGFPVGHRRGGYVLHGCRHSAVQHLANAGNPDIITREISGHRSQSTFERYHIRQDAAQAAALSRTLAYLERTGGDAPAVTPLRQVDRKS